MSKIKAKIELYKDDQGTWSLSMPDYNNVLKMALDRFVRGSETIKSVLLDLEIKAPHVSKTISQLGYLHAAVWPVFYEYFRDQGYSIETDHDKEMVRNDVKMSIGFVEDHKNVIDGAYYYYPKSFAGASKDETSEQIEKLIRLAAEYGMIVPGPDEYLEQHGKTEFNK